MNAYDLVRAEVMIRGYDARWADDAEQYDVVAIEAEFRSKLTNPDTGASSRTWTLAGKLDGILRERGGEKRTLLIEHKTSSADVGPGSDYLKRLRLDGQVSIYYAGAAALGHQLDGVIYDVLIKPSRRPLRATPPEARKFTKDGRLYANQREVDESPEEYRDRLIEAVSEAPNEHFVRAEVVRLETEVKDGLADVWAWGQTLREAESTGRHPRNPDACVRYGSTCPFFPVCTGEASLEDATLYRRSEVLHPELNTNADDRLLSSSRLSSARACQRLHRLTYIEGYRPAEDADALRFGSLIHLALEAWWLAPQSQRLDAALATLNPSPAILAAG